MTDLIHSRKNRLLLLLQLLLDIALIVMLLPPPPQSPQGIVFITLDEGVNHTLYRVDVASGEMTALSIDRAYQFALSADGTMLAYSGSDGQGARIYITPLDGFNPQPMSSGYNDTDPQWSPDGRAIIFTRWRSPHSAVFIIDLETGEEQQLTPYGNDLEAEWSPDGERIIFTTSRDGFQELYTMLPDGTGLQRLTVNEQQNDLQASFSPDGTRIAYMTNYSVGDGTGEIWLMDAEGSNQLPLTQNNVDDRLPVWSPDSSMIAFITTDSDRTGTDIYLYDVAAGEARQLTREPGYDYNPQWSSDGRWLVYIGQGEQSGGLYRIRRDGSQRQLILEYDTNRIRDFLWIP